jgi:hypothetical protein
VKRDFSKYFKGILQNYRKGELADRLRHGLLFLLIPNLAFLLLLIPAEALWFFSPALKSGLFRVFFLNLVFLVPLSLWLRDAFFRNSYARNEKLLLQIGQGEADVSDKLLNHYQLARKDDPLAAYAVECFIEKHPAGIFRNSYRKKPVRRKRNALIILAIVLVAELILLQAATERLLHPEQLYEPENPYSIVLMPDDTTVFAYDSLQIRILRRAPQHFKVELFRQSVTGPLREILLQKNDSLFVLELNRLQESRNYTALLQRPHLFYPRKYADRDSLSLRVLRRPQIRSLDFRVESPAYSGVPPAQYQGNIERLRFLPGSNLQISTLLSDSAGTSFLVFRDDTLYMQNRAYISEIALTPETDADMLLMFYNKQGTGIRAPLRYRVELERDGFPVLQIIRPEASEILILDEDLRLPLMALIRDDYGISDFRVRYRIQSPYSSAPDTTFHTLQIPFEYGTRLQTLVHNWTVDRFIAPGSELHYYFELLDNDTVKGPKIRRSALFFARFPTLGDLYERQNENGERNLQDLTQELENSREIAEAIENLRRDLLREGEMDWQKRSALEESLESLERGREQLEKLAEELEEQQRFMEENALFDEDVLERFGQLQELMNELIDDELFDMLRELQEKLQRNDMSNMEEVLKDFSEKAKQFEQSLDRMLEVFKRIQQEQRLQELAKRMKESLRQQEQLLENAPAMSPQDASVSEREIAEQTEALEERSRQSAELFEGEQRELFEDFLEAMDSSAVSRDLREAADMFRQSLREQGLQKSGEAKAKMQELSQRFSDMAAEMMQQQRGEISRAFRALLQKSIYLSAEQENTAAFGEDLDAASPLLHQFTSRQGAILAQAQDINRHLLDLSKKTFLVDKAIGTAIGQVIGNLISGIRLIEEANISGGKTHIDLAFAATNRLSRLLLERSEMAEQQQGNASGMEFYLQQLQQMAGQQQELNMGMPQPGPGGSPAADGMMDQLARMAARQQALRRALKEIAQGMSDGDGGRRIAGDLDKIAADMQEVIDQMRRNQVSRQTYMRQEQIVQRLLDASRSATSRDYKKERESRTGTQIVGEPPRGLPADRGERDLLLEHLRRAVQASDLTPAEKRDMERYLESLMEAGRLPEEARP